MLNEEKIRDAIRPILDPDVGLSIESMGLIYGAEITEEGKKVKVLMTLTSPMCPAGPMLIAQVTDAVEDLEGVEQCKVELIWDPPWDPRTMASDEVKEILGIWD